MHWPYMIKSLYTHLKLSEHLIDFGKYRKTLSHLVMKHVRVASLISRTQLPNFLLSLRFDLSLTLTKQNSSYLTYGLPRLTFKLFIK
jgi:hypothetical protein